MSDGACISCHINESVLCSTCASRDAEVAELRAEVERLRRAAENARESREAAVKVCDDLRAQLARVTEERDKALAKAEDFRRDWMEAKSEFGAARNRMSARLAEAERERDAEADRIVERIAKVIDEHHPDCHHDGDGCESGDPADTLEASIVSMVRCYEEHREAAATGADAYARDAEEARRELDAVRAERDEAVRQIRVKEDTVASWRQAHDQMRERVRAECQKAVFVLAENILRALDRGDS